MKIIDGNPLMNGDVSEHRLGDWRVRWEAKGNYRPWCIQRHSIGKHPILVVMQNPGSLTGLGENITKDTTLNILREVFEPTEAYPIIVNLFDFSTPKPADLFKHWNERDSDKLIFDILDYTPFKGVMYAYGDCEYNAQYSNEIKDRINYIKSCVSMPEITSPLNKSQTPKHPLRYRIEKLCSKVTFNIQEFLSLNLN